MEEGGLKLKPFEWSQRENDFALLRIGDGMVAASVARSGEEVVATVYPSFGEGDILTEFHPTGVHAMQWCEDQINERAQSFLKTYFDVKS